MVFDIECLLSYSRYILQQTCEITEKLIAIAITINVKYVISGDIVHMLEMCISKYLPILELKTKFQLPMQGTFCLIFGLIKVNGVFVYYLKSPEKLISACLQNCQSLLIC